jgi:hypothetical protein
MQMASQLGSGAGMGGVPATRGNISQTADVRAEDGHATGDKNQSDVGDM